MRYSDTRMQHAKMLMISCALIVIRLKGTSNCIYSWGWGYSYIVVWIIMSILEMQEEIMYKLNV